MYNSYIPKKIQNTKGVFSMSMSLFCSIGSILLGLLAWGIPCFSILKKNTLQAAHLTSCISFLCCAISLWLQLMEIQHRIQINDTVAVMDTIDAVVSCAVVLIIGTVLTNLLSYKVSHER